MTARSVVEIIIVVFVIYCDLRGGSFFLRKRGVSSLGGRGVP
jgi:hypothetical protein